jgi:hypothetical protein
MALDLYHLTDLRSTNRICSLDDKELQTLEPSLVELKKRTGVTLDLYGKTRLHPNQIEAIRRYLSVKQSQNLDEYKSEDLPTVILKKLSLFGDGLIAIGD